MPAAANIFSSALEIPLPERRQFVHSASEGDAAVEAEVIRLLNAHERNESEGFVLDHPVLCHSEKAPNNSPESVGSIVGRYKLLEEIGEGGMGVVYMAEQVEDVRRRVALKVIKQGMDTRQVIARFEAERQAMAMFNHPNITRVLDAGITRSGRPFFVMELVRGRNILDFAAEHAQTLDEKLNIFLQVCEAVQHAHQKGIIHRDLKPSNVMVSLDAGKPTAKVIDFGIAKAVGQQRLTDKTLFTRYAAMVGTPHYMSPEQAALNGIDVDTRSDIFALGVLLYEMLTGTTPLSKDAFREVGPLSLQETIRDADYETPSARIQRLTTNYGSSEKDQLHKSPQKRDRRFFQRVRGELDWVVMKALQPDRTHRYSSAHAFAEDIRAYLRGEPVRAAPPSRFRHFSAYYRRHRTQVLTATSFIVLLALSTVVCLAFALQSQRVNGLLAKTNRELVDKISQLRIAEETLRANTNRKLYDTAISAALAKFDMEFAEEIYDIADQMFPMQIESSDAMMDGVMNEFHLCMSFDKQILLDLPHSESLASGLAHIQRVFDADEEFGRRIFADLDGEEFEEGHAPECLMLQDAANKILPKHRHRFYRHLLDEFRRTFGEQDERVSEALLLLASSLQDIGKHAEAESRLREALVVGSQENRSLAEAQLRQLQSSERAENAIRRKR
ncbi:MAG: serine/threonine protein kinase [Aureliella sp.]